MNQTFCDKCEGPTLFGFNSNGACPGCNPDGVARELLRRAGFHLRLNVQRGDKGTEVVLVASRFTPGEKLPPPILAVAKDGS